MSKAPRANKGKESATGTNKGRGNEGCAILKIDEICRESRVALGAVFFFLSFFLQSPLCSCSRGLVLCVSCRMERSRKKEKIQKKQRNEQRKGERERERENTQKKKSRERKITVWEGYVACSTSLQNGFDGFLDIEKEDPALTTKV